MAYPDWRDERRDRKESEPVGFSRDPWRDEPEIRYGGSSSNPFYGDRPLTRAGAAFDSHLFGAHGYPNTPWHAELSEAAFQDLVYGGGRPLERGIGEFSEGQRQEGPFRGLGPRGYRRSDERIQEDVCQCLTDDPHLDPSNIDVAVSDSEVILSGSVQSRGQKRYAEELIEGLPGVRDVVNGLRVVASEVQRTQPPTFNPSRQRGARR
jgi:hypothetical protein